MPPTRLLATKLNAPPPRPNLVARPRLLKQLEQGLDNGSRLTLISAPAGYGKTTLAAAWLQGHSVAWLTLDAEDNDPARFFRYLAAALQKTVAGIGAGVPGLLEQPQFPAPADVMAELINDISELPGRFVLVLDDYHCIRNPLIHEGLESLLEYQPPNLHLALTTREDPPFPLSRLRARGQLTEIRALDLRFTGEEARDFFTQAMGLALSADSIEHLETMTEGWAAGLHLAGLALRGQEDAERLAQGFGAGHRYVIEYLVDEVLKRQPPDLQDFLRRTALLERFDARLCAAVLAKSESECRAILEQLERSNLFITPLDGESPGGQQSGWYRYHRLFADVLRAGLDAATEREAHGRAAAWLERQGWTEEAIGHYLAAGLAGEAARLILRASPEMFRRGEMYTLLGWIDALPPETVLEDAELLSEKALALLLAGRAGEVPPLVGRLQAQASEHASGRVLAVQAWMALSSGGAPGLAELAQRALDALPPEDGFFQFMALAARATGQMWTSDLVSSTETFYQMYDLGRASGSDFITMVSLYVLSFNLTELGRMSEAEALCREALARSVDPRGRLLPMARVIEIPMASILAEQQRLDEAEAMARRGLEPGHKLFSTQLIGSDAEALLANIAFLRGRREEAWSILEQARRYAREHNITYLTYKMEMIEANFHLLEGNLPAARRMIETLTARIGDSLPAATRSLDLYRAELLMQEGNPGEALAVLDGLDATYRKQGALGSLITILAATARAWQMAGKGDRALRALEEAARLAAPGGYRHVFLRYSPAIRPLLLKARPVCPAFADEVLALMGAPEPAAQPAARTNSLPEPLSEQELRVLRLVAAGCSNQEIAEELVVSVGTAKWHVHNILGKLDASNRAQAIARARELGLLG